MQLRDGRPGSALVWVLLGFAGVVLTEEETEEGGYIKPNAKFVTQITEWGENP